MTKGKVNVIRQRGKLAVRIWKWERKENARKTKNANTLKKDERNGQKKRTCTEIKICRIFLIQYIKNIWRYRVNVI